MKRSPELHAAQRRIVRMATAVFALALAFAAPRVYAQIRFGVVDVRRAVAETNEGRAALAALRSRFEERQVDLNQRSQVLAGLKAQLERPRGIPPARLQKMARDYYQRAMELQQSGQQYTEEIQVLEQHITRTILQKMQPVVRQVGQSDNFQLIVDQQVVHFAPAHLDLTDRVIQSYNQQHPFSGSYSLPNLDAGAQQGPGLSAPASLAGTDASAPPTPPAPTPATNASDAGAARPLPGVFFSRDGGR